MTEWKNKRVMQSKHRILPGQKRTEITTSAKSWATRNEEQKLKLARKSPQPGEQIGSI
jgi:hypothetical protein